MIPGDPGKCSGAARSHGTVVWGRDSVKWKLPQQLGARGSGRVRGILLGSWEVWKLADLGFHGMSLVALRGAGVRGWRIELPREWRVWPTCGTMYEAKTHCFCT